MPSAAFFMPSTVRTSTANIPVNRFTSGILHCIYTISDHRTSFYSQLQSVSEQFIDLFGRLTNLIDNRIDYILFRNTLGIFTDISNYNIERYRTRHNPVCEFKTLDDDPIDNQLFLLFIGIFRVSIEIFIYIVYDSAQI